MASDLVVHLTANATKFNAAMRSARSTLSKFADYGTKALVPMAAGFAAAAGSVYVLTGRISKLASVNDKAIQTGLSGEFIQRLGYAADQSGISAESLTNAIGKMTIAIGKGGKEFEGLKGLNPEQQFLTIAERISKLPTAADRAAAAVKVFGKNALDMTGLFAGGMDDVNKLLAEAKALGIGLSDEALAKAAAADDSIQRMYASFGALFDQLAVSVAPIFDDIATYITSWIPPITEFFNKFNELPDKAKWIGDTITAGVDVAIETIKVNWGKMLDALLQQTWGVAKKIHDVMSPTAWAVGGIKALGIPGFGGVQQGGGGAAGGGLAEAQARLGGLMNQLPSPAPWQGPRLPAGGGNAGGDKLKALFSDVADAIAPKLAAATMAGQGILTEAKLKANFWGSVVGKMFTGEEGPAARQLQPMAAGAMQRGSQEAYSTLVQAMMRTQDPQVKATKEGTKEIVKAIKSQQKPMFNLVNDLMGAVGL